jgi:hypothetical protein
MKGVPNDDHWRLFTQLMNDNIATLADQLEEAGGKSEAHNVQLQKDDGSEDTAMFQTLWTKSEKRNSRQTWNFQNSRDHDSGSNGSILESEKHRRRHTQECYRCHKVGHTAQYCPSTTPEDNSAPTETAAAAETTTTSFENYWMTVTGRSPEREGWNLDWARTSHVCGDRRKFEQYMAYTKRNGREICDFAAMVVGKAIGH